MAYNKAKAEKEWLLWKESEEKKLRALGVDEGTIQDLRQYDWQMFKSDRRYYEWMQETDTLLDFLTAEESQPTITTVEDLLENIENPHLYQALLLTDKLTLQIILWRMEGYSSREISELCGLTVEAVNFRMWHLRKKLKKILGASNI